MFRFRKPPAPPKPWHAHATTAAGFAARHALLGAAAAARASADALRWAAERRPAPPAPPPVQPVPVYVVSPPPAVMARRPAPAPRCGKGSSKVLPILAVALAVGIAVSASGVKRAGRDPVGPPAPQNLARLSPNKLTDYAADSGVVGGAKAALKALEAKAKTGLTAPQAPLPPLPPTPPADAGVAVGFHISTAEPAARAKAAVQLRGVRSAEPHTTREAAVADALLVAQGKLAEQLGRLDPPVEATPSLRLVRGRYLREDSVREVPPAPAVADEWRRQGLDPMVWVTADFEVTEEQVRQLRADRRLAGAAPLFLLPVLLSGGLWGFLRLDAFTRGHLTGWLLAGVGGLVIGLAAVAALVRPW